MNKTDPYTLLASLGVSFRRELNFSFCPEECLVALVEEHNIVEDRRLLSLTILAFEQIQDSLRPDLLTHLAERLTPRSRSVLGGIIFRGHLSNPARWKGFHRYLIRHCGKHIAIGTPRLLEVRGKDEHFLSFGVAITPVARSDEKKLVQSRWLLKNNPWLTSRILFGPSSRADIVTIRKNFYESNPNRIAKRFNCSVPSITKIWNEIILAQTLGLEVGGLRGGLRCQV